MRYTPLHTLAHQYNFCNFWLEHIHADTNICTRTQSYPCAVISKHIHLDILSIFEWILNQIKNRLLFHSIRLLLFWMLFLWIFIPIFRLSLLFFSFCGLLFFLSLFGIASFYSRMFIRFKAGWIDVACNCECYAMQPNEHSCVWILDKYVLST